MKIAVTFEFKPRKLPDHPRTPVGEDVLIDIAEKWADYISDTFGGDTADELLLDHSEVKVR